MNYQWKRLNFTLQIGCFAKFNTYLSELDLDDETLLESNPIFPCLLNFLQFFIYFYWLKFDFVFIPLKCFIDYQTTMVMFLHSDTTIWCLQCSNPASSEFISILLMTHYVYF